MYSTLPSLYDRMSELDNSSPHITIRATTGLVLELVITQGRARNLAAAAAQPGAAAVSLGVFSPRQDFRAGGGGNVDINSAEAADLSS